MSRVASRSLDGLVAMLRAADGRSEHEALEYLNCSQLLLPGNNDGHLFPAAAKAAKHPQHAAFGSFLVSLSHEKLSHMRFLVPGRIISHAQWDLLNMILQQEASSESSVRNHASSAQKKMAAISPLTLKGSLLKAIFVPEPAGLCSHPAD